MPLLLDRAKAGSAIEFRAANCITVGLVNNMPDAAFEATERQFIELLRAATTNAVVRLKLFAMPDLPRAESMRREVEQRYRDVAELCDMRLDGLIVTGTEPRAANLAQEPYWAALTKVIDWARSNTASTVWSCLAAHAAVLRADGIERYALAEKLCGVFDCETVCGHELIRDGAPGFRIPHSRFNDLPEPALVSCGYQILTRSAKAGVDTFVKQDNSLFVFFQGHPEYEADSLLREYRRDVSRFLTRERAQYPALPEGYFDAAAMAFANGFAERALRDRHGDLIADFPMAELEATLESTWRRSAMGIYGRWLDYLMARKADRRTVSAPRHSWHDGWPRRSARRAADASAR